MGMSGVRPTRYNNIKIKLEPNFYYTQLQFAQGDTQALKSVQIYPDQISSLEILKSFETHVTDVTLTLENMDSNVVSTISEGKYLIYIYIYSENASGGGGGSSLNYFICDHLTVLSTNKVFGTIPALKVRIKLKSVIRSRYEQENGLSFLLGGKGNDSAAIVSSSTPYNFFTNEMNKLLAEWYTSDQVPYNMTFCETSGDALVTSTPSNGYKMECNTNFEVIDYFFKHYPMFKTPFGWMFDEFPTALDGAPTRIVLMDFVKYQQWATQENVALTKLMNMELSGDKKNYASAFAFSLFNVSAPQINPYYDMFNFLTKNWNPKIYAIDASSGNEIDMTKWNAQHKQKMVIANSFSEIKLKLVDNPIYKEYLTFLSSQEIGEMQNFLSIFEALHPEFQTYTFNNLQVGDIDIGTVFTLKQSTLPNAAYGYDRIANAYQILFTYTKARPETSGFFGDHESANNPQNSTFTPRFVLSAEAAFLVVDKAPNGVSDFSNIKPESALSTQSYSAGDIANLNSDPCIDGAATGSGTNLPTSGDVASNAEAIMASGATYKWGCWGPGRKSRDDGHVCGNEYDCSGFVWQALTMAGYPKSIPVQSGKMMQWASKHGGLVESNGYDKMKRGDLVFVYRASGEIHHVAIATGPSEVIHALNHKLGVKKSPASRYLTRGKRYVIYRLDPKFKTGTKKTEGEK